MLRRNRTKDEKNSNRQRPLYNQGYNDTKGHTIFEQAKQEMKNLLTTKEKKKKNDNMLDKSICMREQMVAGYNNRTNRSLQATEGEDECCRGITREKGIQLSSLLFPVRKERINPPSNNAFVEVFCSIHPVLTEELQKCRTPPGYSTSRGEW